MSTRPTISGVAQSQIDSLVHRAERLLGEPGQSENPFRLRRRLEHSMWEGAGVVRTHSSLERTLEVIADVEARLSSVGAAGSRVYNLMWNEGLNLANIVVVARALCLSAIARTESRGAHYRSDHPDRQDTDWLSNVIVSPVASAYPEISTVPATFPYVNPPEGQPPTSG